ncbi:MAG: hypothetical protein D3903_05470 [Candidatus Electrothrix sp. GM3_4]|nr:hypothetical protein [Candidatus Electrothrix sp. GM3_4]
MDGKPGKAEEILSKKYVNQDFFAAAESAQDPNYASFFKNYAYKIYQEKDFSSVDPPVEHVVLMIFIVDMYNRGENKTL